MKALLFLIILSGCNHIPSSRSDVLAYAGPRIANYVCPEQLRIEETLANGSTMDAKFAADRLEGFYQYYKYDSVKGAFWANRKELLGWSKEAQKSRYDSQVQALKRLDPAQLRILATKSLNGNAAAAKTLAEYFRIIARDRHAALCWFTRAELLGDATAKTNATQLRVNLSLMKIEEVDELDKKSAMKFGSGK